MGRTALLACPEGGTNLQAILDAIDEGIITNAEVSVVISNNAGAYALERAKKKEIDAVCLSPKTFAVCNLL